MTTLHCHKFIRTVQKVIFITVYCCFFRLKTQVFVALWSSTLPADRHSGTGTCVSHTGVRSVSVVTVLKMISISDGQTGGETSNWRLQCCGCIIGPVSSVELETKVAEDYAKMSQSQRSPLLGPSPGWMCLLVSAFTFKTLLRHFTMLNRRWPHG